MKNLSFRRMAILGAFICIGLVIFVVGVFSVGSERKTFSRSMTVRTIFDDVGGLHEGNNVWVSGVKVGVVDKISFYGTRQVEIIMKIEKGASQHIAGDARTKIGSDGLIGNRIVVIFGGSTGAPPVVDGDLLKSETTAGMDNLFSTLQDNNRNLLTITDNLMVISQKIRDGEGTLGKLVNSPSTLNDLQTVLNNLKKASVNGEKAMADIHEVVSALKNKGTLVNQLSTDTTLFSRLKSTVEQLSSTSSTLSGFSENLQRTGNALNQTDNTAGMLLHDKQLASDLKEIVKSLRSSSELLDQDLRAAQHNFLLKGYFKKQEKENKKAATGQDSSRSPGH
jgi:phospholipid/cholesterol/gamma-HCH transport system substrate-binding protein